MLLRIRLWAPTWYQVAAQHFASGPFEQLLYTSTVCLAVSCLDGHSDLGLRLTKTGGYWTGFVASAQDGDLHKFWIEGTGSSGFKRDPYARELAADAGFPDSSSIIRFSF